MNMRKARKIAEIVRKIDEVSKWIKTSKALLKCSNIFTDEATLEEKQKHKEKQIEFKQLKQKLERMK